MCYSFIPRKFAARPERSETAAPADMRQAAPAVEPPAAAKQATPQSYVRLMEDMKRWMERRNEETADS